MSKVKNSSKVINWITGAAAAYFVGSAIAGAIKRKHESTNGVGKVERIKRRVYKEVSLAQQAGVDFSKKFAELTNDEIDALEHIGKDIVMWKQSKRAIESGKPYAESYYGSLRRAWNAVSGVSGIGTAYNVKDANGNVVLTWIEDAANHVEAERRTLEAEARAEAARKRLRKTRTTPIAPVVPQVRLTKQQEILKAFPYLKTHDLDGEPRVTDKFNYVIWKTVKNTNTDQIVMQGAMMAFMTLDAAERCKKEMFSGQKTYNNGDARETYRTTISIKPVSKVKLDGVFGIGALSTSDILEPELLEYVRMRVDDDDVSRAINEIFESHYPLSMVDSDLEDEIRDAVEDWCTDNAIDADTIWELVSPEEILWAI